MQESKSAADSYREWIDQRSRSLRSGDPLPSTRADVKDRTRAIRKAMRAAAGEWPDRCPLAPEVLGTLNRDGYRIERIIFQTRTGVFTTANAYVPSGSGPFPAVLCVHGHWAGARRDPVVQSRCIGLAKLGFFVLAPDAWGAGERGTRPGENEYHGGLLGASLWPVGTPLWGLQLYDNVRALDYLQSRPEVDDRLIGCTGASGGGNQTTSLSAFDPRIKCAVPVCSVGTWHDYLRTACCVDEVVPGGLTFAEEGDLLGLVAPGGVMVITATRDTYHFGPKSSAAALDGTRAYFRAVGAEDRLRHQLFESGHDYSRPMREAMYGWMTRILKEKGDGSPIPEPEVKVEDPAALACYPPAARPARVMTTQAWVSGRWEMARKSVAREGKQGRANRRKQLRELLLLPDAGPQPTLKGAGQEWRLETEEGVTVPVLSNGDARPGATRIILLHPGGRAEAMRTTLAQALMREGYGIAAPDLRGCGSLALPNQDGVRGIDDHNLVEWGAWIGRPLLGQWVHDVLWLTRALQGERTSQEVPVVVIGIREAGMAALCACAVGPELHGAVTVESLASFRSDSLPHQQRMAVFAPGLARVGDIPQIAALCHPRTSMAANPVRMDGMPASQEELVKLYGGVSARDDLRPEDAPRYAAGLSDQGLLRELLLLRQLVPRPVR